MITSPGNWRPLNGLVGVIGMEFYATRPCPRLRNGTRIFDAGATTKGRPYFVMEYIEGAPITQYCDRERMTAKERLAVFLAVCRAVQHAHHRGVIHRDLKPSNVLVSERDGAPVPKVIDFGIAKATD